MSTSPRKDILLIQPSYDMTNPNAEVDWETNLDSHEKTVPIGLVCLASVLQKNGLSADILDTRFYSKKQVHDILDERMPNYSYVGISAMTNHVAHALDITDYAKSLSNKPVIWGGVHPTLFPEQCASYKNIDYVIYGEAEHSLTALLKLLASGNDGEKLKSIEGLAARQGSAIVKNPVFPIVTDLDNLAEPDYSLLEIEKYLRIRTADDHIVRSLAVMTSRGCPYNCAFCLTSKLYPRRWRFLQSSAVLDLLEKLVRQYKLQDIAFFDDYFFGNHERALEIVKGMIERKLHVSWSAKIRANSFAENAVNDDMLKLMRESGCYCLQVGFESGSEEILKMYNKKISIDHIMHAVRQGKKYGIIIDATWIMGAPGESLPDIKKTYALIARLVDTDANFLPRSPGAFRPYPGSELYEKARLAGFKEPDTLIGWRDFTGYSGIVSQQTMPWTSHHSLLKDLRIYGLLLQAFYKRQIPAGPLGIFLILKKVILLRYRYSIWFFRIEALAFKVAQRVLLHFPNSPVYRYLHRV
jgi:anaerobic magnesium-protoporphyrin IX monomethyl ester cyclase